MIHDAELRGLVDGWLTDLGEEEFVDVLPLVRRTFGTFSAPERRLIAERLGRHRAVSEPGEPADQPGRSIATWRHPLWRPSTPSSVSGCRNADD